MADRALPPKDLTSTLNLRQLRAIPSESKVIDLRNQLSPQDLEVVNGLPKDSAILIALACRIQPVRASAFPAES